MPARCTRSSVHAFRINKVCTDQRDQRSLGPRHTGPGRAFTDHRHDPPRQVTLPQCWANAKLEQALEDAYFCRYDSRVRSPFSKVTVAIRCYNDETDGACVSD